MTRDFMILSYLSVEFPSAAGTWMLASTKTCFFFLSTYSCTFPHTQDTYNISSCSGPLAQNWVACYFCCGLYHNNFPLTEVIKQCWGEGTIVHVQFIVQSFNLLDKQQHCAMGRCVNGDKFLLFTEIHVHLKSVICVLSQFAELYFKAFVFKG